jgi:hypothetical protein
MSMFKKRAPRRASADTTSDPTADEQSGSEIPLGGGSTPDPYLAINARSCYDIVAEGPHAVSPTNPPCGGAEAEAPPPPPAPAPAP